MKSRKHVYLWTLRSKEKRYFFLDQKKVWFYWHDRAGLTNPGYLTPFTNRMRLWDTKEEAETYYMKKALKVGPVDGVAVRKKIPCAWLK